MIIDSEFINCDITAFSSSILANAEFNSSKGPKGESKPKGKNSGNPPKTTPKSGKQ